MNKEELELKARELNFDILEIEENEKGIFIKVYCKKHKKERKLTLDNFLKKKQCGCRLRKYTTDEFKEDIKDTGFEVLDEYINDSTKIHFKCLKGHIFEASPNKIKHGRGCPECKKEKLSKLFLKTTEQFKKDLEKANPSLKLINDYKGAFNEVEYRCKICGRISKGIPDKLLNRELGCRFCNASIPEQIIIGLLEKLKVNYEFQKIFDECKYINNLKFDFYLPDYNLCIEYQGEQHFKPVDFSYTPTKESKEKAENNFKKGLERDEIKRKFCKEHNINLIEIP